MNPLSGSDDMNNIKYDNKVFKIDNINKIMHQNLIFNNASDRLLWFNNYNRYGWMDIYNHDIPCREYVFITKPDLFICTGTAASNAKLISSLENNSVFMEAFNNHKEALLQLQYSIPESQNDMNNPFMRILTNSCISKMEVPSISANHNQSTGNTNGSSISYRTTSLQSDTQFDFTLTFRDTAYLDIYTIAKCYDEYIRLLKAGFINFTSLQEYLLKFGSSEDVYKTKYITNHIDPSQFSVYKFIVGEDGETLLYWIKATGVMFMNVPRDEFGDPPSDGFKVSLSFHANFISDDMDPVVLGEFNTISQGSINANDFIPIVDQYGINNEPARFPVVQVAINDNRVYRHNKNYEYRLKWTNQRKTTSQISSSNFKSTTQDKGFLDVAKDLGQAALNYTTGLVGNTINYFSSNNSTVNNKVSTISNTSSSKSESANRTLSTLNSATSASLRGGVF